MSYQNDRHIPTLDDNSDLFETRNIRFDEDTPSIFPKSSSVGQQVHLIKDTQIRINTCNIPQPPTATDIPPLDISISREEDVVDHSKDVTTIAPHKGTLPSQDEPTRGPLPNTVQSTPTSGYTPYSEHERVTPSVIPDETHSLLDFLSDDSPPASSSTTLTTPAPVTCSINNSICTPPPDELEQSLSHLFEPSYVWFETVPSADKNTIISHTLCKNMGDESDGEVVLISTDQHGKPTVLQVEVVDFNKYDFCEDYNGFIPASELDASQSSSQPSKSTKPPPHPHDSPSLSSSPPSPSSSSPPSPSPSPPSPSSSSPPLPSPSPPLPSPSPPLPSSSPSSSLPPPSPTTTKTIFSKSHFFLRKKPSTPILPPGKTSKHPTTPTVAPQRDKSNVNTPHKDAAAASRTTPSIGKHKEGDHDKKPDTPPKPSTAEKNKAVTVIKTTIKRPIGFFQSLAKRIAHDDDDDDDERDNSKSSHHDGHQNTDNSHHPHNTLNSPTTRTKQTVTTTTTTTTTNGITSSPQITKEPTKHSKRIGLTKHIFKSKATKPPSPESSPNLHSLNDSVSIDSVFDTRNRSDIDVDTISISRISGISIALSSSSSSHSASSSSPLSLSLENDEIIPKGDVLHGSHGIDADGDANGDADGDGIPLPQTTSGSTPASELTTTPQPMPTLHSTTPSSPAPVDQHQEGHQPKTVQPINTTTSPLDA